MKYRLAVSDYDDTLLRSDDTVSDRTLKAIDDFRAKGGVFTLCTGRMLCSILPIARRLGLKGLIATYQGALITDIETGDLISHMPVKNADAVEILKVFESQDIYCQIYLDDKLIIDTFSEITTGPYIKACGVDYNEVHMPLSEYLASNGREPTKIIAMTYPDRALKLIDEYNERFPNLSFNNSKPSFIEIIDRNTGKGNAVKTLCNIYGIPLSESVAFGDALNDSSMIKSAALGVAVGNALNRVKAIADVVTDTNDDDGVAKILEKIIGDEDV